MKNLQFTRVMASLTTVETLPFSVSSLKRFTSHHRPSLLALRQVNNGDRWLGVGAGSTLEKVGLSFAQKILSV
jgi:hypothetical protein